MVFGVVLFTLLVQGLTTQWFLERLGLVGEQPIRQQYSEAIARRIALNRVLNYLLEAGKESEIDPEFYRYELQLVQGQLKGIEEEIEKLQNQYPQLRSLNMQQLREKLLDIEADTYAELIRAGRLNNRLSPVLQEILAESTEDER
jgi:CPA1 family monovalent cation:H+ antiporter